MLSIQEMVQKTEEQRKQVKHYMDSWGSFHPEQASILNVEKAALRSELKRSIHNIPLREFLQKSSTVGASYLVPDKLHDILISASEQTDLVPLFSRMGQGPYTGGDMVVPVINREAGSDETWMLKPVEYSSGGQLPSQTVKTTKTTISLLSFAVNVPLGRDLIEDAQYDVVQEHVEIAGRDMGRYSTNLALAVLKTGTDGVGTVNAITSGTQDTTTYPELLQGIDDNHEDGWVSNTLITGIEPLEHTIMTGANATGVQYQIPIQIQPATEGYNFKLLNLDVLLSTSSQLHDSTDGPNAAWTTCVTIILDRNNALFTYRKKWLAIENYANPVSDLGGVVVTARQDSVSLYNDSVCVITENTS